MTDDKNLTNGWRKEQKTEKNLAKIIKTIGLYCHVTAWTVQEKVLAIMQSMRQINAVSLQQSVGLIL